LLRLHLAALDVYDRAERECGIHSREADDADEAVSRACRAQVAHLEQVLRTIPTTLPGIVAFVSYLRSDAGFASSFIEPAQADQILETVRVALSRHV
jgi:hypothetical protein